MMMLLVNNGFDQVTQNNEEWKYTKKVRVALDALISIEQLLYEWEDRVIWCIDDSIDVRHTYDIKGDFNESSYDWIYYIIRILISYISNMMLSDKNDEHFLVLLIRDTNMIARHLKQDTSCYIRIYCALEH